MTVAQPLDPRTRADLELIKTYFEELIGCVVGCGCWERGWDSEEAVTAFARNGFLAWGPGPAPTPVEVLAALDRCFASLTEADRPAAETLLELSLDTTQDFRDFFGPSRECLAAQLRPATS